MSNLVTPMLTSVDNSPTVDFYTASMCFSNSPCAIINNGSDQICIGETSEWNDLEHLVGRNMYKTSTPNKSYNIAYNRRIFSNNCSASNDSSRFQDSKQNTNDFVQGNENSNISSVVDYSKVINNLWNTPGSENNSCSKACVNVNMGYNEGSSLESMVSNKKVNPKTDFNLSKNAIEMPITKPVEPVVPKIAETSINKFIMPLPSNINNNYQTKVFKNGSKTGHSRQWGSCGSSATFHLNFDEINIKSKLSTDFKPLNSVRVSSNAVVTPAVATTTTTEMRNKSFSQNNRLKRISQLSFEAEFDADGRTHEQITIDFMKFDPNTMSGQITLIELSYFKTIKPEEFLSFKWTGLTKHTHAPSIVASTRWFNQLNFWAQRIVLECTELNRRSEMLIYIIRIIKKLVDSYNNLSSAMALMSALEVECIHRLKQTWNTVPSKDRATYRRMEELFSSANNFEKLRDHINSLKLPCIPYLGLYLTDLTYINIAHSKLSEFESQTKTDQINNILRTVSEFQQSKYDINQINNLYRYLESQRYIEELQKIIEENNYRTSIALEPNLDSSAQNTHQQQQSQSDFPTFSSISPQKTPPSYACKHPSALPSLQSPISPKPLSSKPHNDSINEVPEQQLVVMPSVDDQNMDGSIDDDLDPANLESPLKGDSVAGSGHQDGKDILSYDESVMASSRHSDEESVRVNLLCGTGKKSQFKKRNSMSTSHRFKRHSQSSSSRHRGSSKTTTLSNTSQSGASDNQPSMSLLDDSYLDAALTETGSGALALDVGGGTQAVGLADMSAASSKHGSDVLCSPPICKCIFKGDVVDLKPKATGKGKTEYSNLVNIAHAAEAAVQFSERKLFYYPSDSDHDPGTNAELSISEDHEPLKLVCQGVLSRMVCLKNSKKARFSMWNRQWMVLVVSRNDAFLAFFENSQFRAIDRKDFKSKKCHVQDLRRVVVSRHRPSLNKCISEQTLDEQDSVDGGSEGDHGGVGLRKFFFTDKEYGTVYKFRDPSSISRGKSGGGGGGDKRKSGGGGDSLPRDDDGGGGGGAGGRPTSEEVNQTMPSLTQWYYAIHRCIRSLASATDDNKDLIVLGDS